MAPQQSPFCASARGLLRLLTAHGPGSESARGPRASGGSPQPMTDGSWWINDTLRPVLHGLPQAPARLNSVALCSSFDYVPSVGLLPFLVLFPCSPICASQTTSQINYLHLSRGLLPGELKLRHTHLAYMKSRACCVCLSILSTQHTASGT